MLAWVARSLTEERGGKLRGWLLRYLMPVGIPTLTHGVGRGRLGKLGAVEAAWDEHYSDGQVVWDGGFGGKRKNESLRIRAVAMQFSRTIRMVLRRAK